jgi:hypothetical protein
MLSINNLCPDLSCENACICCGVNLLPGVIGGEDSLMTLPEPKKKA